jgi:hypothetical protein
MSCQCQLSVVSFSAVWDAEYLRTRLVAAEKSAQLQGKITARETERAADTENSSGTDSGHWQLTLATFRAS